jgi:serine protease Do
VGAGGVAVDGNVEGDVITGVNGQAVHDARDLARTIGGFAPGSAVKLNVLHKGQDKTVDLTLGTLPNSIQARANDDDDNNSRGASRGTDLGKLGLSVAPASSVAGAGKQGVVVTNVDPNGPASERGFKEGDVILQVGDKDVSTPSDVRDALASARSDKKNSVLMRVRSGDQSRFVAVPLGQG